MASKVEFGITAARRTFVASFTTEQPSSSLCSYQENCSSCYSPIRSKLVRAKIQPCLAYHQSRSFGAFDCLVGNSCLNCSASFLVGDTGLAGGLCPRQLI